jgi:hypothetical protein
LPFGIAQYQFGVQRQQHCRQLRGGIGMHHGAADRASVANLKMPE